MTAINPTWLATTRTLLCGAEAALHWHLRVSGADHLKGGGPTFYVANHFTRSETLLLPFVIDRATGGRYPRTVADAALFSGVVGRYFKALGVVSTQDPSRDRQIIGDLLTGRHDWAIYPEGLMMKTKQVTRHGKPMLTTAHKVGPPHTGAAVLALKAEIYRRAYFRALADGRTEELEALRRRFGFTAGEIQEAGARVIPVTITYYPLRPGTNGVVRYLRRHVGTLPSRLREELEIEGNLLLHANVEMNIHFGAPLDVASYLGSYRRLSRWLPFLRQVDGPNPLLKRAGRALTDDAMIQVYHNATINLDHLVAGALRAYRGDMLRISHLRRVLYLMVRELRDAHDAYERAEQLGDDTSAEARPPRTGGTTIPARVRLHPDLLDGDLRRYLTGDTPWPALLDVLRLGEGQGFLKRRRGRLYVDPKRLAATPRFHRARRVNTLYVLANELLAQGAVLPRLAELINAEPKEIRERVVALLVRRDRALYEAHYTRSYQAGVSKPEAIGAPVYLPGGDDVGVVLSHGFLSSPGEVRPLAEYLQRAGCTVYIPRLPGHGTVPERLADVHMEDWVGAYDTAYTVIRTRCRHVVFGGFSSGGLLALLAASRYPGQAVFAINPPIYLRHVGAILAPLVNLWNRALAVLRVSRGRLDSFASIPENPDLNYNRVYVSSLFELGRLMAAVRRTLCDIRIPTLILQGVGDPVVHPNSSNWIYQALRTPDKLLETIDSTRHVMVLGAGAESVYARIGHFLATLNARADHPDGPVTPPEPPSPTPPAATATTTDATPAPEIDTLLPPLSTTPKTPAPRPHRRSAAP